MTMTLSFRFAQLGIPLGLILLLAIPARAQQDQQSQDTASQSNSPSNTQDDGTQPAPGDTTRPATAPTTDNDVISPVPPPVVAPETQINQAGTANPLSLSVGHLRWGSLYIGDSDARGVVDVIRPSNGKPSTTNVLSLMRSSLIFDKEFGKSRLALQYQPRIGVANGQVAFDYLNQTAAADTYFLLSPHWTMGLFDHFTYSNNASLIGGVFADANTVTSTTIQNNFLDGTASWLSNSSGVSFSDTITPRTVLTVSPALNYSRTSGFAGAKGAVFSNLDYATSVGVRHAISPRTSLLADYTNKLSRFKGTAQNSVYNTYEVGGIHQFTQTIGANAAIGVTEVSYVGRSRLWTATGSVSVFKAFQRGNLSFVYSRGDTLSGFVTNHLGEREDVLYRYRLSRNLSTVVGGGYQRELQGGLSIAGKYLDGQLTYSLTPTLSVFTNYAYKLQSGNNFQVFAGTRTFFSGGIRWDPTVSSGR